MEINLKDFKHYHKNPHKISPEQIIHLAESLSKFGDINGIVLNIRSRQIISGNQRSNYFMTHLDRCKIHITKKYDDITEVGTVAIGYIELDGEKFNLRIVDWDEKTEELANLEANKAGGEWDGDILMSHFDTDTLLSAGFTNDELENYVKNMEILPDETKGDDDVPDIDDKEPKTCLNDIYDIGNHRLICGDSTDANIINKLLDGKKPILMVTDPPYGVKYDPEWRNEQGLNNSKGMSGKVQNDDKIDWTDAYSLFEGDVCYIWHAGKYTHIVAQNIESIDFQIVSQIIWAKQHFVLSRGDYHWKHEPCWYAVRKGKTHNWQGARDQATVWDIKNNNSFGNSEQEETWGHGTQKPVDCMLKPVFNNSKKGDSVYDPFGGSGTTLIACEKLERQCFMIEIDKKYCDVIIKRYQSFCKKNEIECLIKRNGDILDADELTAY